MRTPSIADAKAIAKRDGLDRVVIWFEGGGRVGYASYGATRALCDSTHEIAERMYDEALRVIVDVAG